MEGGSVLTATPGRTLSVLSIPQTPRLFTPAVAVAVFHRSSSLSSGCCNFAPPPPNKYHHHHPLLLLSKKSGALTVFHSVSPSTSSGDIPPLSSDDDVILLNVSGMMCEGCASSVKRILENQTQVSSATVNLATETATIWPVSEAKVAPNWQKVIGEELAKNLTNSGFTSNLKGEVATEGT